MIGLRARDKKPGANRKQRQYVLTITARLRLLWLRWLRFSDPLMGGIRKKLQASLFVRLMTAVVLVTVIAVLTAGTFIMTSTKENLFNTSVNQSLSDSARATAAAQDKIDAFQTNEQNTLSSLMGNVREILQNNSGSSMIYVTRQAGQPNILDAPQNFSTDSHFVLAVTEDLRNQLATGKHVQLYQSVEISDSTGKHPGIVVATHLDMPGGAGIYQVYIGYSFEHTENSLQLMLKTLVLTSLALVLLIALLIWFMSRTLFTPVREAAIVSKKLADGEKDARMKLRGDEYFDLLSVNFNEMAETLNARIQELDKLSQMQQRFVSDVSHELRTPFTTIRLANDLLQMDREQMSQSQLKAVDKLGHQVDRFDRLLADLLEMSRYDAGRVRVDTEATQLAGLCQELIENLQPLSKSLIDLRVQGGYDQVNVDPVRIRRIVSNLIGNAIEHGEEKPIVVTLDSNSTAYAITVRDFGIGMTEEQQVHVFERFWRADPSRKRTLGGTGLGLAIAREDALVHGGALEVWSAPEQGAVFRLTLPRNPDITEYYSPLPLVPEDVVDNNVAQRTGALLKRPHGFLNEGGI